jgi:high-affinity nickel-transport protein
VRLLRGLIAGEVVLASIFVALAAATFKTQLESVHAIGGIIGTLVSAFFLRAIAAVNLTIFFGVLRAFRHVRGGGAYVEEDMDLLLAKGGCLARIFRPLFAMVTRSWHMYPLGFLFGLGFDTATEIGVLGISAAEASKGLPIWSIMVFPALFTAGMSLIDTTDGVLMLGAYGWAFNKPIRKLYYNLTITFISVVVAVVVGGALALGLIAEKFHLEGRFWNAVENINEIGILGFVILGIFIVSWLVSTLLYRIKGYDRLAETPIPHAEPAE